MLCKDDSARKGAGPSVHPQLRAALPHAWLFSTRGIHLAPGSQLQAPVEIGGKSRQGWSCEPPLLTVSLNMTCLDTNCLVHPSDGLQTPVTPGSASPTTVGSHRCQGRAVRVTPAVPGKRVQPADADASTCHTARPRAKDIRRPQHRPPTLARGVDGRCPSPVDAPCARNELRQGSRGWDSSPPARDAVKG
eukprot:scaffold965_cov344-Prasinococcus_capsulatus_cf.AAC.1